MKRVATFMVLIICITIIAPAIGSNCSGQSYGSSHAAEDQNRFATTVVDFTGGGSTDLILGGPRGRGLYQGSIHVLSLGDNGSVTLGFDVIITNGPGPDFIVFENPFYINGTNGAVFAELSYVEVSSDGLHFARFPSISLTPPGGMMYPDNIENLAGVYPVLANVHTNNIDTFDPDDAGGDPFDLDDLSTDPLVQSSLVDLQNVNYIQLIDIYGDGSCLDSQGNPIYDPLGFGNTGADIDAISVINYCTSDYEWTGDIRIEGKNETVWNGEVTVGPSYITAENTSSGQNETYYIPYPSVLGALDEASKQGSFSYIAKYYPSWNAFLVTAIEDDADWWHYWVNDDLPMVGCGAYELTEDDYKILWGYVEDWYPDILKISVNKHEVNTSEEFTVSVHNWTMDPVEDAVVHIGSSEFNTDEGGKVTTHIDAAGTYEIYAEKEGCVRSEKVSVKVKTRKLVEISKPEDGAIYVMNRKLRLRLQRITIFGPIDIEVKVTDDVEKVEFYINNNLKYVDTDPPFSWVWDERAFFRKTIKVKAYIGDESQDSDQKEVRIFHI